MKGNKNMKTKYIIAAMDGTQLVPKMFATEKAAQNKLRDLTERGIIAGIAVKIISVN